MYTVFNSSGSQSFCTFLSKISEEEEWRQKGHKSIGVLRCSIQQYWGAGRADRQPMIAKP